MNYWKARGRNKMSIALKIQTKSVGSQSVEFSSYKADGTPFTEMNIYGQPKRVSAGMTRHQRHDFCHSNIRPYSMTPPPKTHRGAESNALTKATFEKDK